MLLLVSLRPNLKSLSVQQVILIKIMKKRTLIQASVNFSSMQSLAGLVKVLTTNWTVKTKNFMHITFVIMSVVKYFIQGVIAVF